MTFYNPLVLFGLFAASIPFILHLLNLRKLKDIEFSSLKFLKELQKTKIKRLKIKQILLLVLRTLLIISIVFAFARPTVNSNLPVFGAYTKTSAVILLDNSFSMDLSDEYGNRFNQAKKSAAAVLNALKDGDEVSIITMADLHNEEALTFSRNLDFVKNELGNTKVSISPANLENSMRYALSLLDKAVNINREIFIISDYQPNVFFRQLNDTLKLNSINANVYLLPIGTESKSDITNLAIDTASIETRIFQKNKLVEFDAKIKNSGVKPVSGSTLSLFFNGQRVAQKQFDIMAGEVKSINIAALPTKSGINEAKLELEGDALNTDNTAYLGFIMPEKPNIALFGNSTKDKFIATVLNARYNGETNVNCTELPANSISGQDLSRFDAVIVAGGGLRASDYSRLAQYAQNGGSALIFADDQTSTAVAGQGLANLGFGHYSEKNFSKEQAAVFTSIDKQHPLFEGVFQGNTDSKSIAESPKIYKAAVVNGGFSIVNIPGGALLSESKLGNGKILYCAVTPDMQWSTMPMTGFFPTLIYRAVFYLSAKENIGYNMKIGSPFMLPIPKKFTNNNNFKIIDPNKNELFASAAVLPGGAFITLDKIKIPGVYSVYNSAGDVVTVASANIDGSESDLTPTSNSDLDKKFKQILPAHTNIKIIKQNDNINPDIVRARAGTELWQIFVLLTIIFALAEMYVAKTSKLETIEE